MNGGQTDLFICGGGSVGLSIAWQAASLGWKVIVADARGIGRGASWSGAGILPPSAISPIEEPFEKLRSLSHALHPQWAKQLREETGIDTGYLACGGIYVARTLGELATLTAQQSWWEEFSIPYEKLSADETARRVPALCDASPNILQAWSLPTESQLRNPRHLKALRLACESRDVTFLENEPIVRWEIEQGQIRNAVSPSHRFAAERYCITAGAWSSQLLKPLNIETGILPVRGQMILYKSLQREWLPILNEGHRYIVARDDGHVLAGSCEEEVGFQETTTESMIEQLHAWATSMVRSLESTERVRAWAGLRPGSFDSLPYLGKLPGLENAFIASGHFRNGLHLSPGTAQVMLELMTDQPTSIDLNPFRVTRGMTS